MSTMNELGAYLENKAKKFDFPKYIKVTNMIVGYVILMSLPKLMIGYIVI